MNRTRQRDALRLISDVVRDDTGSVLTPEARRRLEAVLARFGAVEGPEAEGDGFSEREATILFADLRGFTALVASYPAKAVVGFLNRCFGAMVDVIAPHY